MSTLKKDTGRHFLKNHVESTFHRDFNVPTTGAWQPLPTPGVRGCLGHVFGGQTAWERSSPTNLAPTSSSSSGWSNENRRGEHGGSLGGQHSWAGGRHQAGDQLGCQVATIRQLLSIKENICAERHRKSYALQDAKK